MAAITTNASGFWDVTTTWTGGVVPVNGDTVTMNHAVTVRDARTVGASPASGAATKAIAVNATLTLANGAVLTVRGDIGLNSAALVMQAGAILEFDSSAAASPSTTNYVCGSINATAGNGFPTITGTSGSRCTVRSNSGGGNGNFIPNDNGPFVADYCDFQRIGIAGSTPAVQGWANTAQSFHFGNCTFDANCGPIGNQAGVTSATGSIVELINVTHKGSKSVGIPHSTAAPTGSNGRRIIQNCVFFGTCNLYAVTGYKITNTMFLDQYDCTGGPWWQFQGNFIAIPQSNIGDWPSFGDHIDTVVVRLGTPTNPHGLTTSDFVNRYTGCIFDMPDGTDGAGDMITFNNTASPKTIRIDHCILLPSATGVQAGTLISMLGGTNVSAMVEHCTYFSDSGGASAIYLGETFTGFAKMLASGHSNLAWSNTAGHGTLVFCEAGTVTDVVLAVALHHNGVMNAGTDRGYSVNLVFGSKDGPGLNDVRGDPGFVDSTRNIKTWSTLLGGAGTAADAITELGKINESGYNSNYTIAAYTAYIRAGFECTNIKFRTGDPNGQDIGAVSSTTVFKPQQSNFPKSVIARLIRGTL
jgi:hypothetical protein